MGTSGGLGGVGTMEASEVVEDVSELAPAFAPKRPGSAYRAFTRLTPSAELVLLPQAQHAKLAKKQHASNSWQTQIMNRQPGTCALVPVDHPPRLTWMLRKRCATWAAVQGWLRSPRFQPQA